MNAATPPAHPAPELFEAPVQDLVLDPGAARLGGFARTEAATLLSALAEILAASPLRHMTTPGGWRMSAAMTNCGATGWITDRSGYRYDRIDPTTARPWAAMPTAFAELATRAARRAGYADFLPDMCLINRYEPGARMSLHQDRNERDLVAPIVSVSLGLPATFLWGGLARTDRTRRVRLVHGDVVVWGGPSRMIFHGIDTLKQGEHPLTGPMRFNLTFRRAL